MRPYALGILVIFAACETRPIGAADGGGAIDAMTPTPDATTVVDLSVPDADRPTPDMGSDAFCESAEPRALIVGERELNVVVETGTTMTNCCSGEQIRFVPHPVISETYEIDFSILRFPDTPAIGETPLEIDLRNPPEGWLFTLQCNPYELCHVPRPHEITGTLTIDGDEVGQPGYRASLCATLQPSAAMTKEVRLVANEVWINTACTYGMDQTCNDNPMVSSFRGTCEPDGTCTCHGAKAASGRCL